MLRVGLAGRGPNIMRRARGEGVCPPRFRFSASDAYLHSSNFLLSFFSSHSPSAFVTAVLFCRYSIF
jgi:hypothetical protein